MPDALGGRKPDASGRAREYHGNMMEPQLPLPFDPDRRPAEPPVLAELVNPFQSPAPADASLRPVASPPPLPAAAWGFWATLGWSLVCLLLFLLVQTAVAAALLAVYFARDPGQDLMAIAERLETDGLLISLATLASGVVCTGFLALVVRLGGFSLAESLGWKRFRPKQLALWSFLALLLVAAQDGLTYLLDRPIVPPFMESAYQTAGFLPLLFLAVIVAAPVSEETFFRGFLFRGLAHSRLRTVGAILITSVIFALIHLQYDAYGMASVLVIGFFLGGARAWTGSTTLAILLHGLTNLVAMIECVIKMEFLS
jgi:membrane protease YdiL (CAAX protease family)